MKRQSIKKLLIGALSVLVLGSQLVSTNVFAAGDEWRWVDQETIEHTSTNLPKETYKKVKSTFSLQPAIAEKVGAEVGKVMKFQITGMISTSFAPNPIGMKNIYIDSEHPQNGLSEVFVTGNTPVGSLSNITLSDVPTGGATDVPYIIGRTTFEGGSIGNIMVTVRSVDNQNKEIAKYCIQPNQAAIMDSTCTTLSSSLSNDDPNTNGIFRTAANLPPGNYTLEVDQSAENFLKGLTDDICKGSIIPLRFSTPCAIYNAYGAGKKFKDGENPLVETEERFMAWAKVTVKDNQNPEEVVLDIKRVTISPLSKALSEAIATLGEWVQASLKWVMGQLRGLLEDTADYVIGDVGCKESECGMIGPWTAMRNIGLSLLVMALIVIAFANVLQIDIEQYGMNRMIPKIIISIILAFTSWIIVTFFFDFTKAIQDQAIALLDSGGSGGYGGLTFLQSISISTPSSGNILGNIGSVLLLIAILFGTLICGVVLLFTLVMRIVMLSFLLAVAPLAFILNIVPFTSSLYKQWWTEFWKWMFMGPIALVIISLGAVISSSATGGEFGGKPTLDSSLASDDSGGRLLIGLIIFAASMYVAATLPMKWGGAIMKGWGKAGKSIWGATGGLAGKGIKMGVGAAWNRTGVPGAMKSGWTEFSKKGQMKTDANANAMLHKATGGIMGMDDTSFRKNQKAELMEAKVKNIGLDDKEQFTKAIGEAKDDEQKKVLMLAAMRKGKLNDKDAREGGFGEEIARLAEADDTGLMMTAAMKDHRESLIKHGKATRVDQGGNVVPGSAQLAAEDVMKKFSSAKGGDFEAIEKRGGLDRDSISKYGKPIGQASVDKLRQTNPDAANRLRHLAESPSGWGGLAGATEAEAAKNMNQAVSRAESDARGMADVQDEADRINRSF